MPCEAPVTKATLPKATLRILPIYGCEVLTDQNAELYKALYSSGARARSARRASAKW